jgi:ABC-type bacteriocin/lantibiotic exporter with double-glycine peptidase domain
MGCNCKKTAEKASKYTDEETVREVHGTEKAAMFISKIFIVILLFVILIIAVPLIMVYFIFVIFTGRSINIGKLFKRHGKRK